MFSSLILDLEYLLSSAENIWLVIAYECSTMQVNLNTEDGQRARQK